MGLKKGTKLTDNPKVYRTEVRLDKEHDTMLQDCSEKLSISKTDVIVKGIELVNETIK